jgi:hypothetical protein
MSGEAVKNSNFAEVFWGDRDGFGVGEPKPRSGELLDGWGKAPLAFFLLLRVRDRSPHGRDCLARCARA